MAVDQSPNVCPKCGAGRLWKDSLDFTAFMCGSVESSGKILHGDKCRIRELEAENERLRKSLQDALATLRSQESGVLAEYE